jgi:hypothetical protein
MVEDYRSEESLFAGGSFQLEQACGVLRAQSDHLSKSLNVKFPREIENIAKNRETRKNLGATGIIVI